MTTALVVEDDDQSMEAIVDTLFTLGHAHERATNLQDARELIQSKQFDYGLFDLEIPVKPGRGFANTEHGVRALEEFQQQTAGRVPALVMSGHHAYCMNQGTALRAKGAAEFIAKPFPLEGRTLGQMIRHILPRPQANLAVADTQFQGGPLVFRQATVDLLGVTIISNRGGGQAMALLRELTQRDHADRFAHKSGEQLALGLGSRANIGTVTSCVRLIRTNVSCRLKKHLGLETGPNVVIAHDEQGYFLRDWITVQLADDGQGSNAPEATPAEEINPAGEMHVAEGTAPDSVSGLNSRQNWVLKELRRGVQVDRSMLEHRFGVGEKTAKRDLAGLAALGSIAFVRAGNGGHYRLTLARQTMLSP